MRFVRWLRVTFVVASLVCCAMGALSQKIGWFEAGIIFAILSEWKGE